MQQHIHNQNADQTSTGAWLVGVGGLIVGLVIGIGLSIGGDKTPEPTTDEMNGTTTTATTSMEEATTSEQTADRSAVVPSEPNEGDSESWQITADDQTAGETVTVSGATLAETGWVAIREANNGRMGNVLGAALREAGSYSDVRFDLLRAMEPGETYYAVVYRDNGDGEFQFTRDAMVELNQQTVFSSFTAIEE